MRSAGCGVRGVRCGVRGAGCQVRSAECGVRGAGCGVGGVRCLGVGLADGGGGRSRGDVGEAGQDELGFVPAGPGFVGPVRVQADLHLVEEGADGREGVAGGQVQVCGPLERGAGLVGAAQAGQADALVVGHLGQHGPVAAAAKEGRCRAVEVQGCLGVALGPEGDGQVDPGTGHVELVPHLAVAVDGLLEAALGLGQAAGLAVDLAQVVEDLGLAAGVVEPGEEAGGLLAAALGRGQVATLGDVTQAVGRLSRTDVLGGW